MIEQETPAPETATDGEHRQGPATGVTTNPPTICSPDVPSGRHMIEPFKRLCAYNTNQANDALARGDHDEAAAHRDLAEMLSTAWHCIKAEADRADRAEAMAALADSFADFWAQGPTVMRGDWRKGEHRPASLHEIETLAWALASTIQKTRLERTNHHD